MTNSEPSANATDMLVVHRMFRREFGLMPGLVRAVEPGDSARAALVADHIDLMSEGLGAHHRGEDDQIWPVLRERCPVECAPLVAVMEDQHHAIHGRLAQVATAAQSWCPAAPAGPRDVLAEAVEQLLAVTRDHLTLEEERVVPLIEKYLTQPEYLMAAQESQAVLSPEKLIIGLGMTLYGGNRDDVEAIVGHVPAEQRAVITEQASSAYAAYAEKLYGTTTPPTEAS
jgi:hemerythrin-like domain-containing protein